MSRYLLDTNAVSELTKRRPNAGYMSWIRKIPELSTYLSILTFGEIYKGIAETSLDNPRKAAELEEWCEKLYEDYEFAERKLPVTKEIAKRWGDFYAIREVSSIDGFLAATAIEHNFTLVTRNEKDFEGLGVRILNPWTP